MIGCFSCAHFLFKEDPEVFDDDDDVHGHSVRRYEGAGGINSSED